MRFYMVEKDQEGRRYISAEVSCYHDEGIWPLEETRQSVGETSLQGVRDHGELFTREELLAGGDTEAALVAWEADDDSLYEAAERRDLEKDIRDRLREMAERGDGGAGELLRRVAPLAELYRYSLTHA